ILILKPGQWINRLKETAPGIITSLLSQLESTTATQDKKQSPAVDSASSTSSEPIFHVGTDRDVFYCVSSDGPTTLTIKANTDPSVPVLAFRWRLNTKKDGQVTDWEGDYLEKDSSTQFSYTLNADVWGGTNNFNYPPLLGESWFEFQIFLPDGSYQTKIYKEVTYFPCAQ
ncbi:MAG: hypothetical protein GXY37_01260, partial [Chloroflexi bacterium]|nr:hypothetical protein [Chloroflexota bacterium]